MVGQRHQQPVFQRGEKHVLPVLVHLSQRGVNLHRPKFHQGTPALSRPAQHTADPGGQFPDPEGLGDVVVRPHVQAHDHTHLVVPGSEKDDRHVPLPLDRAADIVTAAVRQREIQHRQIEPLRFQCLQRVGHPGAERHAEPLLS